MHSSVIITQCACLLQLLKIGSFFNFKIITDEDMRHIETSISNKNISIVMWSILNPDYHLENHIYFTLPSQWSFLVETFPSIPLHFVQLWNYNAHNKTTKMTTSFRLIRDSILPKNEVVYVVDPFILSVNSVKYCSDERLRLVFTSDGVGVVVMSGVVRALMT